MRNIDIPIIEWLLEGDPAIRWQVMRDLLDSDPEEVRRERDKVALEGWGARLLSHQDPSGRWAEGHYSPKWTSTTYSLLLLRRLGLPPGNPQALAGCRELLEGGYRGNGIISFSKSVKTIDLGVLGIVLNLLSYFDYPDERIDEIAESLIERQEANGSWIPVEGVEQPRYILAGILIILEGLLTYGKRYPSEDDPSIEAQARGREYLLNQRLYLNPDGTPIHKNMTLFSFPPRWHYDVLTALDYFRASGAERDERLVQAIQMVESKQRKDGTWPLQNRHPGKTFFEMEMPGKSSRWNTLRALRLLKWWSN